MRNLMTYINISLFLLLSNYQGLDFNVLPLANAQNFTLEGSEEGSTGSREYTKPNDLTTEEARIADQHLEEGYINRAREEACNADEDSQRACAGFKATVFGDTGDAMVQAATMALSVMGLAGGKIQERSGAASGEPATEGGEATQKEQNDYCRFIPIGTTVIGQAMQTSSQQSIAIRQQLGNPGNEEQESMQARALYAQAETHESRAKTAKFEATGYGATLGCYVLMTTPGIGQVSIQNAGYGTYMKMGASGFLAWFYSRLAKKNQDYADRVREIADGLPGRGDCNPITDRACFCAQPENIYNAEYCVENAITLSDGRTASVGCVDRNGNIDDCGCKTQGCLDALVAPLFSMGGIGSTQTGGAIKRAIAPFGGGDLAAANFDSSSIAQGAFKKLKDLDDKVPAVNLNEDQKKIARGFVKAGLPPRLSAQLAATKPNSFGLKAAGRINGSVGENDRPANSVTSNQGGPSVITFKKKGSRNTASNSFKNPFSKSGSKDNFGVEVMNFANKATKNAAITRNPSKNVFDIISKRYQKSGFQRLQLELE